MSCLTFEKRFLRESDAPSVGAWQGWSKFVLRRKRRTIGADRSEYFYDLDNKGSNAEASDLMAQ